MNHYTIGRKVAKLRKQLNLSSTELAKRAGLSQPQISRLENGQQGFRSNTLDRISTALGVTPAYFFMEEAQGVEARQDADEQTRRQLGEEFAKDMERQYGEIVLTPGFKQILYDIATTLARNETDCTVLRKVLHRILAMSNEERIELLGASTSLRLHTSERRKYVPEQ